jgi:hypothetical protein
VILHLPALSDLLCVGLAWLLAAALLLAGSAVGGRALAPEIRILAGWGVLCLVLTLWGTLTMASMRLPALAFALAAGAVLLSRARRPGRDDWLALGRAAALSLPFWLIVAPMLPSQPDTWINLLPNAVYLVDHGYFPADARPESHSWLPGAPYDTQFLSFLAGCLWRDFPATGMSLVNLLLQLLAGLLVARVVEPGPGAPSWSSTALGLLFATLLNPGFVPRYDLSAYGEPALAAATVFAVLLWIRAQGALAEGGSAGPAIVALALVLAAIVNTKQSGIGLVLAIVAAGGATAVCERRVPRRRAAMLLALALLPALLLYGVWRLYVLAHFAVGELKPLPLTAWHWSNLAIVLEGALHIVTQKGFYFGCVALSWILLVPLWRRRGWTVATRLLAANLALNLFYDLFLVATYIGHFSGRMSVEAHSFFRYNTHLSLVLVLGLAAAARDIGWLPPRRAIAVAAVPLMLAAPALAVPWLHFDRDPPQPLVWDMAKRLAARVVPGDRLALLLPGDDDGATRVVLEGILRDTPLRLRDVEILARPRADARTLAEMAERGVRLAFISCTPGDLAGVAAGRQALLRFDGAAWRPVAVWDYPPRDAKERWVYIVNWRPLCRSS